jgi:hypothetical protein
LIGIYPGTFAGVMRLPLANYFLKPVPGPSIILLALLFPSSIPIMDDIGVVASYPNLKKDLLLLGEPPLLEVESNAFDGDLPSNILCFAFSICSASSFIRYISSKVIS